MKDFNVRFYRRLVIHPATWYFSKYTRIESEYGGINGGRETHRCASFLCFTLVSVRRVWMPEPVSAGEPASAEAQTV